MPSTVEDRIVADHVLLLTINRPEVRNAVNGDVAEALGQQLERAEQDREIRVVVLTGAGDQAFCAGADIKAFAEHGRGAVVPRSHPEWGFAGMVRNPVSKPLIAAVNGVALGGGMELVLACDLAVAAENAVFGFPEVSIGVVPAGGGATRLIHHIPRKAALRLLVSGDQIDATTARDLGLVNEVAAPEQVLSVALELAARVAGNAPLAVQATKRIALGIANGKIATDEERWPLNDVEADAVAASRDAQEGAKAFRERRAPRWESR